MLGSPAGLVAVSGTLLVADEAHHVVRRVDAAGTITTFAGTGSRGMGGDGGPAGTARLNGPRDVDARPNGDVVVADTGNHAVRFVDRDGQISTVAGTGVAGAEGDGGPAVAASLSSPSGVAVRPNGSFVVADTGNDRVRMIDGAGLISTIAGGGRGGDGDGGSALDARLRAPEGVATAPNGTLYIAETGSHRIRRVDVHGVITTVAGNGRPGWQGDDGPATAAFLHAPTDVAVLADGGLLIADTGNHVIRHVDPAGVIRTVAGTGRPGDDGEGLPATASRLRAPRAVVQDGDGRVVVADTGNHRVREIVTGPEAPRLTEVAPAGPANDNRPLVRGVAGAGTTVRLYSDAACDGPVRGSGPATALEGGGIAIDVADDSMTTIHADSVDDHGVTSDCSATSVTFVEDSTPPGRPRLVDHPESPSRDVSQAFPFVSDGATNRCTLEGGSGAVVIAPTNCFSPWSVSLAGHPDGAYRVLVRAVDPAGNVSDPATTIHMVDTTAPGAPQVELLAVADGFADRPQWRFTVEPDASATCRLTRPDGSMTAWATCESPLTTHLDDPDVGPWVLEVRATDIAGNTGPAASATFAGRTAPPAPTSPPPPTNATSAAAPAAPAPPAPSPAKPATAPGPPGPEPLNDTNSGGKPTDLRPGPAPAPTRHDPITTQGSGDLSHPTPSPVAAASRPEPSRRGVGVLAAQAARLLASHSDAAAFPLVLVVLLVGFLMLQDRVDHRDPKLAAPLTRPDFDFPDGPQPVPRTLSRSWVARHRPIEGLS